MPMITVEMFEGRTIEQKRELVKKLTDSFCETAGGSPAAVHVVIKDIPKQHWAVGGELCSDKYPD